MTWQLQEAKSKLSELIRRAEREGPQEITRHGRQRFILATLEDWQRRRGSSDHPRNRADSPLRRFFDRHRGLDFQVVRRKEKIPRARW